MNDFAKKIAYDLEELGISVGDTVLVHSSFKSLREPEASPADVIEALLACVGGNGTLVMPALSYLYCNMSNPIFDYNATPSNVGAIPETFRNMEGVLRSMCPTHSCCAAGAQARFVTEGHRLDQTPCGPNSPFARVRELHGKILFLGCSMRYNTTMHAVEELVEPDYLFGACCEYAMTDRDGLAYRQLCRAHDFRGVSQRYERLEPLLEGAEIRVGNVCAADCRLADCKAVWTRALERYREDPHYFIDTEKTEEEGRAEERPAYTHESDGTGRHI